MTLYNERPEAEVTLELMGKMINIRCPSKVQLFGAMGHLGSETNHLFMRNADKYKLIDYVVDVGANIGATALLFHRSWPSARVLAIEPVSANYDYLLHNIQHFPQITPAKMAAYDKRERIRVSMPTLAQRSDLHASFGNSGLFSIYGEDIDHSELVDADTLDNLVDGTVDFLKLDVEGAELIVVAGAKRIIAEDRPIIMMEVRVANMEMAGTSLEDTSNWFKTIGYKLVGKYRGDIILCPKELEPLVWEHP